MHSMSSNNKPIISLNQLTISTAKGRLIDGLTLDVHQGEIIGVVGVSGVGKTSLMLSLFGLLSPSWTVSAQQAMIAGLVIPMARQGDDEAFGEARRQMAYVFQEPKAALNPVDTIATSFNKLFATLNIPKHERKAYTKQLLEMVHLPDTERYLSAYPHELSGGEARRISIAQALAGTPKVIIADEPTGALDSHLKDEMLTLLTDLCHRTGAALLIISHDLPSLMDRCDRFLVIGADGCDTFTPQTIIHNPTANALLNADFGTPPVMPNTTDSQTPILSIHDLTIHHAHRWLFWRKSSPIIEKFNLQVHHGEIVGIMGVSGAGKSTLARAITRLDPRLIISGRIIIDGLDIYQLFATQLRSAKRQAILVMQEVKDSLNPARTIRQSLDEACDTVDDAYLDELLALCGLSKSLLERYPSGLSGGECQRICIVRALLARPKLLILDEPTAMLDRLSIVRLLDLLRQINQTYHTSILIISHDPMVIDTLCHRTIHLQKDAS